MERREEMKDRKKNSGNDPSLKEKGVKDLKETGFQDGRMMRATKR